MPPTATCACTVLVFCFFKNEVTYSWHSTSYTGSIQLMISQPTYILHESPAHAHTGSEKLRGPAQLPTTSSAWPSHHSSLSFQIPHRASPAATRTPHLVASVNGQPTAHGRRARAGGRRRQGRGLLLLRPPAVGAAAPAGPAAAAVRVRHVPGLSRRLGRVPAAARRVPAARPASRIRRRLPQPAAALRARGAVLRPGVPGRARYGSLVGRLALLLLSA